MKFFFLHVSYGFNNQGITDNQWACYMAEAINKTCKKYPAMSLFYNQMNGDKGNQNNNGNGPGPGDRL